MPSFSTVVNYLKTLKKTPNQRKCSRRPRVSQVQLGRIRAAFEQSSRKSTNRASHQHFTTTIQTAARISTYQWRQEERRMTFCDLMLEIKEDENIICIIFFSAKATFHLSGIVNRHYMLYLDRNTLMKQLSTNELPLRWTFSMLRPRKRFMVLSSSTETRLLNMHTWMCSETRSFLYYRQFRTTSSSDKLAHHSIGTRPLDNFRMKKCHTDRLVEREPKTSLFVLDPWDPRTSMCMIFFLWGFVKYHVFILLLFTNLDDRITTAIHTVCVVMICCCAFRTNSDIVSTLSAQQVVEVLNICKAYNLWNMCVNLDYEQNTCELPRIINYVSSIKNRVRKSVRYFLITL